MIVTRKTERRPSKRRIRTLPSGGRLERLETRLMPATYVVNSTFDEPAADPSLGAETANNTITLRSAIQAANLHANDNTGPDRIEFNISGTGVQTIAPFSAWPAITDPIVIDGYTQPGAHPNTLDVGDDAVLRINLNDRFGFGGLTITAGNSTVRGLVFTHFNRGLTLAEHGNDVVAGNFFGLPAEGGVSLGNGSGVYLAFGADGNRIGGTNPADRNVISGNAEGIHIVASSNNIVQGNYIGLDTSRNEPLGNGQGGVIITSGTSGETIGPATGNLIGGTVAGARNIISGSGGGVVFGGDQAGQMTGNLVQGNYFGTDSAGNFNTHFHNNGAGVLLGSGPGDNPDGVHFNTIGGTTAAERNIIANSNYGIQVSVGATDNLIQNNFIGTDPTGTVSYQNSTAGILVQGNRTTILDNLISGNRGDGILIQGGNECLIQGNLIGTDISGAISLFNPNGIHVTGANHVTIGGTTPGARNVISGNQFSGLLFDAFGVGNQIQGNLIGTAANATAALGNGVDGILINFNESDAPSGQTQIGGSDSGAGNVIAFNQHHGIEVANATRHNETDGTIMGNAIFSNALNGVVVRRANIVDPHIRISQNSIHSNGRLGIDLGDDGVTLNDLHGHTGPNNYQNYPILSQVDTTVASTHVIGTLSSMPQLPFRIEFFANASADPSGHGEGQTYLGAATVITNESGQASFDVTLPPVPPGQTFISATASDFDGNTSEFAAMLDTTPPPLQEPDLAISVSAVQASVHAGESLEFTITIANHGPVSAGNVVMSYNTPVHTSFEALERPAGWQLHAPSPGETGLVFAAASGLAPGASVVFTARLRVDADVSPTSITLLAAATTESSESNKQDNSAQASANVISDPPASAQLGIGISSNRDSITLGQAVTYTVTLSNSGPAAATGLVGHASLPGAVTVLASDGGAVSGSTWTIDIGTLAVGASRSFHITLQPQTADSITLTVSATADASVHVGPPASVTTAVVAPTGDDPKAPVVLSADRYGFHDQATLLVVTFSEAVTASTAQNPANYTVLVSANGTTLAVPIARVYYNPDTHEATLRVTRRIYIFRPWMLLVRDGITGVNSKSLDGDGDHVAGGNATIRMSRRNLAGSASQAPGADHVGILNIPHPSPTSRMKQVASQPRRVAVSLLRDNRRARH